MIYTFKDIQKNLSISCDVCVVGSGAGGAVVAKELAEAGLKVVMLEEGGHYSTEDYLVDDTVQSAANLYRDGGASIIFGRPNILYTEGRCLGGSTTVNGGMCWRTPEKIMKRWQWERGMSDFTPKKMEPFFERVEKTVHVSSVIPAASNRDGELLQKGAQKLGYKVRANFRSANHCVGSNLCITGCPTGAKQSTLLSYVPLFLQQKGEVFCNCRVKKVITKRSRAVGVEAHVIDPVTKRTCFRLKVKSKIVVVACGAIQTPVLLKRSGLKDKKRLLGKNLLVHPNAKVLAVFNEEVRAWSGVNQSFQVTEFFDEGILMAVNFVPPGIMALALPLSGHQLFHTMKEEFSHLVVGGALIEDTGSGQVFSGPFGSVIPTYKLNQRDFKQAIRAVALLCEVFFAAGARKCYLPFSNFTELRSIDDIPKIYTANIRPIDLELMTVHIMGTAQMGSSEDHSVINTHGEFHNVQGLYVADASVFPTSIGVNPQITIMALATRTAAHIIENFRLYL